MVLIMNTITIKVYLILYTPAISLVILFFFALAMYSYRFVRQTDLFNGLVGRT